MSIWVFLSNFTLHISLDYILFFCSILKPIHSKSCPQQILIICNYRLSFVSDSFSRVTNIMLWFSSVIIYKKLKTSSQTAFCKWIHILKRKKCILNVLNYNSKITMDLLDKRSKRLKHLCNFMNKNKNSQTTSTHCVLMLSVKFFFHLWFIILHKLNWI